MTVLKWWNILQEIFTPTADAWKSKSVKMCSLSEGYGLKSNPMH